MVAPALMQLRKLIDAADTDSVKLTAIRDVLDRTGHKLPERIEADNAVTIRVEYAEQEASSHEQIVERAYRNGATHAIEKTNPD